MIPADVLETLEQIRIVPVVTISVPEHAKAVAIALRDAGIATAEVALRTAGALDAIREMADVEGFMVGAGTVLTALDADAAIDSGAKYMVSPGFDDDLVRYATSQGVAFVPGVGTATEVQRAWRSGLTRLKVFPAATVGGSGFIAALAGPFPEVRFMPSGGVTLDNVSDYLSSRAVFAASGSWMVPPAAVDSRDLPTITRLTAEAVAVIARD